MALTNYTGKDGHLYRYGYDSTLGGYILQINGSGPVTSVRNGVLTLNDDTTVDVSNIKYIGLYGAITSFGDYAFSNCGNLSGFLMTSTYYGALESIGAYAFANCTSLLDSPTSHPSENFTSIGIFAFQGCTSLERFSIPASTTTIGNNAFQGCTSLSRISPTTSYTSSATFEEITTIGTYAFSGCTSLSQSLTFLKTTTISSYAFSNTAIQSITIPAITDLGTGVFMNCTQLSTVTLNESSMTIGAHCFGGCSSISSISLPNVTSIGAMAFAGCIALTKIFFETTPQNIGGDAFSLGTSNQSVTCTVKSPNNISNGALDNYSGQYTTFVYKMTEEYTGTDGLTYTFINNNLTISGTGASTSLSGSRLTTVDEGTIDMRSMVTCTIDSGVTSLAGYSLRYCSQLTTLSISDTVTTINENTYQLYDAESMTAYVVSNDNANYSSDNGILFNKTEDTLIRYPAALTGSYTIPNTVTVLSKYAFSCSSLSSITLHNSLTTLSQEAFLNCKNITSIDISHVSSIGSRVFYGCSALTSVTLPSNLTDIPSYMFSGCSSLPTITLPSSITGIGSGAFNGCSSLQSFTFPTGVTTINNDTFHSCSSLTTITIPDNVTSIGSYAFSGCSGLTTIVIPDTVTSIGTGAFNDCSGLRSITLPMENNLTINSSWYGCTNITNVYINKATASAYDYSVEDITKLPWYNSRSNELWVRFLTGCVKVPENAFRDCTGLHYLSLADTVTTIGSYAFTGCTSLHTVVLPIDVSVTGISDSTNIHAISYTAGTTGVGTDYNGFSPWYNSRNVLTTVSFASGITHIGNMLLKDCSKVTSLQSLNSVTTVGNYAFDGCSSVTGQIDLRNATSIGNYAFRNCSSASQVFLGTPLQSIGNEAFSGCSVMYLTLPSTLPGANTSPLTNLTNIGSHAFENCANLITSFIVPTSVTNLKDHAFAGCTSLETVTMDRALMRRNQQIYPPEGCFSGCTSLETITLKSDSSTVATYGYYVPEDMFNGCTALEAIPTIPNPGGATIEFREYGNRCFKNCTSIPSFSSNHSGITVGESAFEGCTGIEGIDFEQDFGSIGANAFKGNTGVQRVTFKKLLGSGTIGDGAFELGLSGDTEVYATAMSLNNWASDSSTGLEAKDENDEYIYINDYTHFTYIPVSVTGTDGLTYTFDNNGMCTVTNTTGTVKQITAISQNVLSYSGGSVNLKEFVTGLTVGADISGISSLAFRNIYGTNNLATVSFTDTSFSIGNETFRGCSHLTSVTALTTGSSVSIGDSAFYGCSSLSDASSMGTYTSIGDSAFRECTSITTFNSGSLTSIGNGTFRDCTSLSSVTLPSVTDTIGNFNGCSSLVSVSMPAVEVIDANTFASCVALQTLSIPATTISIAPSAFYNCTSLSSFSVDSNNQNYMSEDGILFNKTKTRLIKYPPTKAATSYTIPSTVTATEDYAFAGTSALTSITFPTGFTQVGDYSFWDCTGLTSLTFGANVTSIGAQAFQGCYSITSIVFERHQQMYPGTGAFTLGTASHPVTCTVRSVNNWAASSLTEHPNSYTTLVFVATYYEGADGLTYTWENNVLTATGTGPSAISAASIPLSSGNSLYVRSVVSASFSEGITLIGAEAFEDCTSLRTVSLPTTISAIGDEAFKGCTALEYVPFPYLVERIGYGVMEDCTAVSTIEVPFSATTINPRAYSGCYNATEINFYGEEPTISTSDVPSRQPFALGTEEHEAYVTVYSINNWAEEDGLEQYSNQYTHFTYRYLVLTGSDGLTYKIEKGVLYVIGSGPMTSLSNGILTVGNGMQVPLQVNNITSVILDSRITSIASNSLKGLTNIRLVTFRSTLADSGNVLDGDYSIMVYNNKIQPRTYVRSNGVWYILDEVPFVLVFSPGGGVFTTDVIPQIKIAATSVKADNGKITETAGTGSYETVVPYQTNEGLNTYLWFYVTNDVIKVDLYVKNLPTVQNAGMTAPTGFDGIRAWEVQAPYHLFRFSDRTLQPELPEETPMYDADSDTAFGMSMERPTTETIRQAVAYPFWEPSREDRLRALVTAPGLGSLDFGNIQNLSITYDSKLTIIPIVCYGYKGTFTMDLGVTKTVSFSYVRVSPADYDDSEPTDSRRWSNAKWIKRLREFTDRWQLMTNGCTFYLKRPNNPRLANGFDDQDPLKDFIGEMDGENCYISSMPIKYPEGHPYDFQGSITLKMGTLYPKQTPTNMIQIILQLDQDFSESMTFYLQYPKGAISVVPPIPAKWSLYTVGSDMKYVSKLYIKDGNNVKTYLPCESYFSPDDVYSQYGGIIYGEVSTVDISTQVISLNSATSGSRTIKPFPDVASATITVYAIGGGGGGGGGYYKSETSQSVTKHVGAGGAGGASGCYETIWRDVLGGNVSYTLTYTVGAGGAKGTTGRESSTDGTDGTDTIVYLDGVELVRGRGGKGGKRATSQYDPGVWSDRPTQSQYTNNSSFLGGNGGSATESSSNNGNDGDFTAKGAGTGGTCKNESSTAIYRVGGGGGGGCGVSFPISGFTIKGGEGCGTNIVGGTTPEDAIHGAGGGGGGGGSFATGNYAHTVYGGGNGGDGILYIVIRNGYIAQ